MDLPEDRPGDEMHTGEPSPPSSAPYATNPKYGPKPLPDPEYRWRLMRLRDKQQGLLKVLASMINILVFFAFMYATSIVLYVLTVFGLAFTGIVNTSGSDPFSDPSPELALLFLIGMVIVIGVPVFLVIMLSPWIRRQVDGMFRTRYDLAARFLHHTDFLRVVAEEDFTQIIIENVAEIPSLRWVSPHQPKTIEQQLEFSSCYWNSILQLSYGPGRLDNASLINGSWTWQVSRISPYLCCGCCCMSYSLWIIILPLLIITCNYHLYRVARISCIIDYLCEDRFA